jgi:hypothetical protein
MSKTDEWNHPPITTLENRKMPGPQFFQTRMGQKFYGSDVPRIAEALEEIGKEMKKTNELKKKELEPEEPLHTVLNDEELKQTRALARLQLTAMRKRTPVVCRCGREFDFTVYWKMYRCYYCGVFFCEKCAAEHFGQSREDYNREHYQEYMVPRGED